MRRFLHNLELGQPEPWGALLGITLFILAYVALTVVFVLWILSMKTWPIQAGLFTAGIGGAVVFGVGLQAVIHVARYDEEE